MKFICFLGLHEPEAYVKYVYNYREEEPRWVTLIRCKNCKKEIL
jgi:hypothetical protein